MINDLERLNTLSQQLEELYKPLRVEEYNAPVNRNQEKERLIQSYNNGKPYNPQFTYRTVPDGIQRPLQEFVRTLKPEQNLWEYLLFKDATQMLCTLETIVSHDPGQITAYSIAADGLPAKELVEQAHTELSKIHTTSAEEETISAEDASETMRNALDNVNLSDWKIIIDEVMSASMMVRSIEKIIKIRKGKLFSPSSIKRLLVHEIGTHVFRYMNGVAQKIHMLRLGLSGYMMTEEGMATYHEEKHNVRDLVTARRYALRVIAAHLSLTHSYFDVFDFIAKYTDYDDAFDIVSRSKRGFTNTGEHGSHIKDKVYFEGFQKVSVHLQANPSDYLFLMGGKVSLDMLPLLKEASNTNLFVSPPYVPELIELTS